MTKLRVYGALLLAGAVLWYAGSRGGLSKMGGPEKLEQEKPAAAAEASSAGGESPDMMESWHRAMTAFEKEDWGSAIAYLSQAQQVAPSSPPLLYFLGQAHARLGQKVEAACWLCRYLAAAPNAANAAEVREQVRGLSGESQDASTRPAAQPIFNDEGSTSGSNADASATQTTERGAPEAAGTTGTLSIQAGEARANAPGWFFVNGQLGGKLPLRKEVPLPPGDYDVRCVTFNGNWFTVAGTSRVEAGKTTSCTIAQDPARPWLSLAAPPGFAAWGSDPLLARAPCMLVGTATLEDYEGALKSLAAGLKEAEQQFVDSQEWQALARASLHPPRHGRMWVNFPRDLGGPHEIDVDQCQSLRRWYRSYCTNCLGPGATYVAEPARAAARQATPERRAAVEALLDQMTQDRQRFLEGVEHIFDQLLIVLENGSGQR